MGCESSLHWCSDMALVPVDIWTISLNDPHPAILTPQESARAARFHFEQDRVHWIAAHSVLRSILAEYLKMPPLDISFTSGARGKPALVNAALEFNLSHSRGWAMVAVCLTTQVGIDLEAIRENVDIAKLLARTGETDLPAGATALFQRWTERESRTKAAGSPLLQQPDAGILSVPVKAPAGFAASVALVNALPHPNYCGNV